MDTSGNSSVFPPSENDQSHEPVILPVIAADAQQGAIAPEHAATIPDEEPEIHSESAQIAEPMDPSIADQTNDAHDEHEITLPEVAEDPAFFSDGAAATGAGHLPQDDPQDVPDALLEQANSQPVASDSPASVVTAILNPVEFLSLEDSENTLDAPDHQGNSQYEDGEQDQPSQAAPTPSAGDDIESWLDNMDPGLFDEDSPDAAAEGNADSDSASDSDETVAAAPGPAQPQQVGGYSSDSDSDEDGDGDVRVRIRTYDGAETRFVHPLHRQVAPPASSTHFAVTVRRQQTHAHFVEIQSRILQVHTSLHQHASETAASGSSGGGMTLALAFEIGNPAEVPATYVNNHEYVVGGSGQGWAARVAHYLGYRGEDYLVNQQQQQQQPGQQQDEEERPQGPFRYHYLDDPDEFIPATAPGLSAVRLTPAGVPSHASVFRAASLPGTTLACAVLPAPGLASAVVAAAAGAPPAQLGRSAGQQDAEDILAQISRADSIRAARTLGYVTLADRAAPPRGPPRLLSPSAGARLPNELRNAIWEFAFLAEARVVEAYTYRPSNAALLGPLGSPFSGWQIRYCSPPRPTAAELCRQTRVFYHEKLVAVSEETSPRAPAPVQCGRSSVAYMRAEGDILYISYHLLRQLQKDVAAALRDADGGAGGNNAADPNGLAVLAGPGGNAGPVRHGMGAVRRWETVRNVAVEWTVMRTSAGNTAGVEGVLALLLTVCPAVEKIHVLVRPRPDGDNQTVSAPGMRAPVRRGGAIELAGLPAGEMLGGGGGGGGAISADDLLGEVRAALRCEDVWRAPRFADALREGKRLLATSIDYPPAVVGRRLQRLGDLVPNGIY